MKNVELSFLRTLTKFRESGIPDSINFNLMNEILISYHSTAIEGSSLTEEETRLLLLEGMTAKGKSLHDHNMVKDHQDALLFTVELADDKKNISSGLIRKINGLVMKSTGSIINSLAGTYDSSKGDFRKSMVHVGERYFSNYRKIPFEVEEVCKFVNNHIQKSVDPVSSYNLAFDTHFKLVSIHPFADGNGRTSRLLSNYILQYHKNPLSIVFKEDKGDYYAALEDTRKRNDIQIFRNFMFSQQTKYFLTEMQKIDKGIKNHPEENL